MENFEILVQMHPLSQHREVPGPIATPIQEAPPVSSDSEVREKDAAPNAVLAALVDAGINDYITTGHVRFTNCRQLMLLPSGLSRPEVP